MVKRVRERVRGKESHPSQNLSLGLERRELELKKHQANQAKERGKENQPSQAKERGKEKENQPSQKVVALEKGPGAMETCAEYFEKERQQARTNRNWNWRRCR